LVSDKATQLIDDRGLTPRERQVATLVAKGFDDREIGENLGIDQGTAKNHVKKIYKKLQVHTRAKLVALLNR